MHGCFVITCATFHAAYECASVSIEMPSTLTSCLMKSDEIEHWFPSLHSLFSSSPSCWFCIECFGCSFCTHCTVGCSHYVCVCTLLFRRKLSWSLSFSLLLPLGKTPPSCFLTVPSSNLFYKYLLSKPFPFSILLCSTFLNNFWLASYYRGIAINGV